MNRALATSTEPLRVLHCYSGNLYGGIERMLATVARCGILTPEVAHEFALVFPGKLHDELVQQNARVRVVGPARMARPWTVFNARRRFAKLLGERRPGVVICHSPWPHAVLAREVRRASIPLLYWAHDVPAGRHWSERLAGMIPPDMILANSEFTAGCVGSLFKDSPHIVVRCPVEPAQPDDARGATRQAIRRELKTDEAAVVIVIAARLEPYKGHALLVESLGMLADVRGWVLWVIGGVQKRGESEFLAKLQAALATAGLTDRTRFLGYRADARTLLAAADIHCQPNLRGEPFGIGFVEALYAGLPVVTTRQGGASEILTDRCGMMTPPGDQVALAQALRRLVLDPTLRRTLGSAGPARAEELCDPSRTMQHIAAVCAEAANATTTNGAPFLRWP